MASNITQESLKPTKGQLTYNRILECAVHEIAKKGFEGLVLTDVAKLAGITRGNLLRHFQSRENLIEQASQYLAQQGRGFTLDYMKENAAVAPNRILLYITATFAWARERRDQAIFLIYLLNRAGYDKGSSSHIRESFQGARHRLSLDIFEMAKEKGSKMTAQGADELALQIHTNLLGYIVLVATYLDRDVEKFERECLKATQKILDSIRSTIGA